MAAKLKKGDKVVVLAGKDKGKEGEIASVNPSAGKAVVEGVNIAIRHVKQSQASQGGRTPQAMPVDLSNLALLDSNGKATRVGFRMEDGKKVRFAKTTDSIRAAMKEEFGYKNDMMIPRLDKIVLNIGAGSEAVKDSKKVKSAQKDLTAIAGQLAVITTAKKSIAGFRVREEMPLGTKVTLRADRMYEFMDRLVTVAMPRIRDFRGISAKSFDGRGNYAMGLKEHIVFPEINFDDVDEMWGMDIVICTTAKTDAEAKALLKHFNMPFNS
ncbi:UNVERIFIED_CONTAM: hypothetical protein GTU68_023660 [Idotea baltica]|nr:hypothetical protein [Idotea baltica]